jgi:Kef-type K+ transport system membrane component KefB
VPQLSLTGVVVVAAVAFAAPLAVGLVPKLRLPAVVLEILAGAALGPSALGWVEPGNAVRLVALSVLFFPLATLAILRARSAGLPVAEGA